MIGHLYLRHMLACSLWWDGAFTRAQYARCGVALPTWTCSCRSAPMQPMCIPSSPCFIGAPSLAACTERRRRWPTLCCCYLVPSMCNMSGLHCRGPHPCEFVHAKVTTLAGIVFQVCWLLGFQWLLEFNASSLWAMVLGVRCSSKESRWTTWASLRPARCSSPSSPSESISSLPQRAKHRR